MTISATTTDNKQVPEAKPTWMSQKWLEPRLVVITLAALLLSMLAERAEAPEGLILALNVISYTAGGVFGLKAGLESLRERQINVDMLMVLAAVGAALINQWHEGAILLFLFSLSNVLQDYAIGRSRQAIRGLLKLYPSDARVRRGETVETVNVSQIRIGEIVLIQPGERIPVDGIVNAGSSAVDQAPITGESIPVEKRPGDKVFAGTLNGQGALDVKATQAATDTTLARIIKMVEEAQDTKAPTERFLDRFEQIYAMIIIGSVALFIFIPPALGLADFASNFYRAMVLMTVASPCALVISTPASFISAIAAAARNGVLFKGGAYLEGMAAVKAVAFDKTGTLTIGRPVVTDLIVADGVNEQEMLAAAAAVEARSEHPLAMAITNKAAEQGLVLPEALDFEAITGRGAKARINGALVEVGSPAHMLNVNGIHALDEQRQGLETSGKTVMVVRRDDVLLGLVAVADQVRPEAAAVIKELRKAGIERVAMLTGDNERVAQSIAQQVGVDKIYAGLLPEDKVRVIKEIEAEVGPTAMVGDGVNDAPGLATASIGIAMGAAGTDVALETADLVLMGDRLELISYAIALSKKARRVVWQNIAFSIGVIIMLILGTFFVNLPLPLGVLGHEGSTVIVVLNGLIMLLVWPEIQRRRAASVK